MIRSLISLAALGTLSFGLLHAQPTAITVKQGAAITYRVKGSTDITQSLMGNQTSINFSGDGNLVLTNKKVATDQINWTSQMKGLKVKVKSPMPIGQGDTTINTAPSSFSTDRTGRLLNGDLDLGNAGGMGQMFQGGLQQFFAPMINRDLKVGETWETSRSDTSKNSIGVTIITNTRLRYIYDGVMDTLKQKALRLRVEIVEMTLSGSGIVAQAGEAQITGSGSGASTLYYSNRDGMLIAAIQNNESSMTMELPTVSMTVPMTYKLRSVVVRQ